MLSNKPTCKTAGQSAEKTTGNEIQSRGRSTEIDVMRVVGNPNANLKDEPSVVPKQSHFHSTSSLHHRHYYIVHPSFVLYPGRHGRKLHCASFQIHGIRTAVLELALRIHAIMEAT